MENKKTKKKNKELKIITTIINFINNDKKLKSVFNHHKQKYKIADLLKIVLLVLKTGISYRNINELNTPIHWNTVYKFMKKLEKYKITEKIFKIESINYVNKLNLPTKFIKIDSSFILNKYGIDDVYYNPQVKKHKTIKISIFTDNFNVPIYIKTYNSKIHDVEILNQDLQNYTDIYPSINNSIFLGDTAYDSMKIKNYLKDNFNSQLLTSKNKRNIKDKNKLELIKPSLIEKQILKLRNGVEHTFNKFKKYKRLQTRYDKYIRYYNFYLYFAGLDILFNQ